MKKTLLSAVAALLATSGFLSGQTVTDSLNFTGGIQTYTIPCGVTSVTIECYGAQGGSGANGGNNTIGGSGGRGAYATGVLSVTPGQILNVFVGGSGATPTGGFNGGANGGSQNAGGGGGASDVRVNGTAFTDRIITAAGGGGGGRGGCENVVAAGGNGGGGGQNGNNGVDSPTSGGSAGGGAGGVGQNGGAAGIGCGGFLGSPGSAGTTGTGGSGGNGQSCCCFSAGSIPGGGGGGGGFVGGGGGGGGSAGTTGCSGNDKGGGGGGAGGSNDISGVTSGSTSNSVRTGNGVVKITYTITVPSPSFLSVPTAVCIGDTVTLSVNSGAASYTWSTGPDFTILNGQGTATITVAATGSTGNSISVYATDVCGNSSTPSSTSFITINPLPTIAATSMSSTICAGDSDTLVATGTSTSYLWSNSATGSMIVVGPSITTTYTVTGTDANGCVASTTTTINVNQLPTVSFSAPSGIICAADGDFTLTGGSPVGGSYSGTAVSGGMFSPSTAGIGSYMLTYSYTDSVGCTSSSADTLTVDACLNVANMSNNSFGLSFMPNPATDVLHVNWDNNKATVSTLEVYDNTGRLVMSKTVNGGNRADLDITTLPAGNYTLTVKSATSKENFGFIKK